MVVETLSIDTINANSPYEVKLADAVDTLCFITDYDAELASYRDEKYGYKDIDENTQRVNNKE